MGKENIKVKPRTLSGFIELLPNKQIQFNKIMDSIKSVYESFGFLPIDTPIMELAEVLLAKAGGETDKQIYQLRKGDNDLVLRFDLTVPFAKYVALNYHLLKFPFKKYQIGKAYRGERAQKGRYREFYQADIDIIGDGELNVINDAEIPSAVYYAFKAIGIDRFIFRVNNRKILNGFFEVLALKDNAQDLLRIIDKLDKIGIDEVKKELVNINIDSNKIDNIMAFINIKGTPEDIFMTLEKMDSNPLFREGLNELKQVINYMRMYGLSDDYFKVDLSLTRGLDYYTGTIYEGYLTDYPELSSICGGGRYDNLTEYYTDKKLPGVGMTIGASRLFGLLEELDLLPDMNTNTVKALIIPLMEDKTYSIKIANILREKGINNQIYYEDKNLKSKINYAIQLGIPYIIFIGEEEETNNMITIKNIETREQQTISIEDTISLLGMEK